ncbi:ATP-binding protein [Evansella cellulosilytica]|uniref:YhaN AAA domain-containing protein n=1 Tax=Evansella cellulosilytica (strain ATCC 21833 / DSM 2522 / FERM P-1141 / JCM 9156 / N-4) TaxID=649639 RepID=E6TUG5_EVAC2|nr:AAA family ATPase [Evansella cellulosilytica]ADU29721.1 hypothetical protein Bcell_1458 [Evansella cellulosilytica DSM 2522]
MMRLLKVHIYGYGKWIDQEWSFTRDGIQIIQGNNESGKSTFMAFIFAIFYGFPKKGEKQYIPLSVNAYGGTVTAHTEQFGTVVIERVKGRLVKGDVTVYFSDGSLGGEQELREILQDIDEKTFKGIFHFDLDSLNSLGMMNADNLNQYLYDAGLSGSRSLAEIEKQTATQMDELFKPRGKKTEMNVIAKQLEVKERELTKWEERVSEYEHLKSNVTLLEQRITDLKSEQKTYIDQIKEKEKQKTLKELATSWKEKQIQLEQLVHVKSFPANGIERLNALNEKLIETKSELKDVQVKEELLYSELQKLKPVASWNESKQDLDELKLEEKLYYERLIEIENGEKMATKVKEDMEKVSEEIRKEGPIHLDNIIVNANMKSEFELLKQEVDVHNWNQKRLKSELIQLEEHIKQLSTELSSIESEMLTEDQVKDIENKMNKGKEKNGGNNNEALTSQHNFIINHYHSVVKSEKTQQFVFFIITLFLAASSIVMFIMNEWGIAFLVSLFTVVLFSVFIWKIVSVKKILKSIEKEKKDYQQKLMENEFDEDDESTFMLNKWHDILHEHSEKKKQYLLCENKMNDIRERLLKVEKDLQLYEGKLESNHDSIHAWCEKYGLPSNIHYNNMRSFIDMCEAFLSYRNKYNEIIENNIKLKKKCMQFEEKVNHLVTRLCSDEIKSTMRQKIKVLQQIVKNQEEKQQLRIKKEERIEHLQEVKTRLHIEISEITQAIEHLFQLANVKEEEAYRRKAILLDDYNRLVEEQNHFWVQMKMMYSDDQHLHRLVEQLLSEQSDPTKELQLVQEKNEACLNEYESAREKLLYVKNEISTLEEDGSYDELVQGFTQLKEELKTLAKKWATLSVSMVMIRELKRLYEKEKQPDVLHSAQLFLSKMTNGEYPRLFAPLGEERFILERKDGIRFDPSEVSRGTCEVLYLSLRLALAMKFAQSDSLPLFMDETIVNIDKQRRDLIVGVLDQFSKNRQVIFLTCHRHIADSIIGNRIFLQK